MILHAATQTAARGAAVLAAAVFAVPYSHADDFNQVGEFEDATIRVERNATDGDTEIVMTAKPLTAVPDAAHYILELENESADPEQTLSIVLPADVTSFSAPPDFVVAGSDYQVGVATDHENGNSVWIEATFSTAQ